MKKTASRFPSQADIARMTGVDQSTVSLVLQGRPNISQKTRARILELTSQLNYQPNAHAQSLRRGKSDLIGVVTAPLRNLFHAQLVDRIGNELRNAGLQMMLRQSYGGKDEERAHMLELLDRRAVGVIVETTHPELVQEIPAIIGRTMPLVVMGPTIEGSASVSCDRFRGGSMAAEHLLSLGRQTPVVFSGAGSKSEDRGPKVEGFVRTISAAGFSTKELLIPKDLCEELACDAHPALAVDIGYQMARVLIGHYPDADSLFCVSDELAMGLISGLLDLKIEIPERIAIVGFDDVSQSRYAAIPLTTIRQPIEEYACVAVNMLLEQIESGGHGRPKRLDCELIVRASTHANWRPHMSIKSHPFNVKGGHGKEQFCY